MSLKTAAQALATDKAALEAKARADAFDKQTNLIVSNFFDRFGYNAVYIDSVEYVNYVAKQQWTNAPLPRKETYRRFQVDDVIVWTPRNTATNYQLEGVCSLCQQKAVWSQALSNYGFQSQTAIEDRQQVLEEQVALCFKTKLVCPMCAANLPRVCGACGRS